MTCYHNIRGYLAKEVNPTGKRSVVYNTLDGYVDRPVIHPCGQCLGCRARRTGDWSLRCQHEAGLHTYIDSDGKIKSNNAFLTLTYDPEKYNGATLVPEDLTNFFKRLRNAIGEFRYYAVGEYGSQRQRPHYHVLLFGNHFDDMIFYKISKGYRNETVNKIYTSDTLSKVWSMGLAFIGSVTADSANYVARYTFDKRYGKDSSEYYKSLGVIPEFSRQSLKPGIGFNWIKKHMWDVYQSGKDYIIDQKGRKRKPPRYYDKCYELLTGKTVIRKFLDPDLGLFIPLRTVEGRLLKLKLDRKRKAKLYLKDSFYTEISERKHKARILQLNRHRNLIFCESKSG